MITDKGQRVLEDYYQALNKQIIEDQGRINKPGFRSQGINPAELTIKFPAFARV